MLETVERHGIKDKAEKITAGSPGCIPEKALARRKAEIHRMYSNADQCERPKNSKYKDDENVLNNHFLPAWQTQSPLL